MKGSFLSNKSDINSIKSHAVEKSDTIILENVKKDNNSFIEKIDKKHKFVTSLSQTQSKDLVNEMVLTTTGVRTDLFKPRDLFKEDATKSNINKTDDLIKYKYMLENDEALKNTYKNLFLTVSIQSNFFEIFSNKVEEKNKIVNLNSIIDYIDNTVFEEIKKINEITSRKMNMNEEISCVNF